MIEVRNLKKSFGNTEAVKGISFSVSKGDVVGLLGPNGAGKTTSMRMLTGFYRPESGGGEVCINGISVTEDDIATKKMIGYLPETSCTYSDMLVCDYLEFIADARMLDNAQKKRGIESSIGYTSLQQYYYQPISQLSKGYKQRVGIASTLVHDPDILILDEPTSGLDPNQIKEIQRLVSELSKEKTIILSTHILSEVEATCERAIIINEGEIVLDKPLKELSTFKTGGYSYRINIKGNPESALNTYQQIFSDEGDLVEAQSTDGENTVLRIISKENSAEMIFKTAVDQGYVLLELSSERSSLEDVFTSLTTDD